MVDVFAARRLAERVLASRQATSDEYDLARAVVALLDDSACRSGKNRYRSEREARASLLAQRRKGRTGLTGAYLCSRCDGWHLTSKPSRAGVTR